MKSWLQGLALAIVFAVVGAFVASLWLEVRREAPASFEPPLGRWEGRRVRVEVLNGAGVDRLARQATERLRELDFDVVYYGNAEEFDRERSVVIARLDSVEPARRVADVLGLQEVIHQPDRNLYLDVTVILGVDWAGPGHEAEVEDAGALDTWWARIKRAAGRLWPG
jgi:predicted outer membrane lipoprotein